MLNIFFRILKKSVQFYSTKYSVELEEPSKIIYSLVYPILNNPGVLQSTHFASKL